jgi:hypothetical protein
VANDAQTLQSLVEQTAPLLQAVQLCPMLFMADPTSYCSLASGWTTQPAASIVPFQNKQQQLRALISQLAPPPPSDALSEQQVTQLLIQALVTLVDADLLSALSQLEKLSWPSRFNVMENLAGDSPTLDGMNYLEILEGNASNLPNVNAALLAGMIVILMNHGGRTLTSIDITVKFMQALVFLAVQDQWQLMAKLGIRRFSIEGVLADLIGEAVQAGMLAMDPKMLGILAATQANTGPGDWAPPGNMPIPFYIGSEAHLAIAAEYRVVNAGQPFIFTNTTPIDTIITEIEAQLMFQGELLDRVEVGLALSKPDIFHFSLFHPEMPPGWVYEIKPWTSEALAVTEALFYADALILAGIPSMPGLTTQPGTSGCVPAPGGWYVYEAPAPGAIVYWYRKATKQEAQEWAKVPVPDTTKQQTLNALKAAGATAAVVGTAGVLAAILRALLQAGWELIFLGA